MDPARARQARPSSEPSARATPLTTWSDLPVLSAALALGIALPAVVYLFARPLALLILAFTIAQAFSPVVDALERRLPRALAAALLYAAILGVVFVMLASIVPTLANEVGALVQRAPELLESLRVWLSGFLPVSRIPLQDALLSVLYNFQSILLNLPLQALNVLFDALVVFFLSLYLLIAGPRLKHFVLCLVPQSRRRRVGRALGRMGRAMGGYVRGAALSGVFVGLLTWVALLIVGLEYRGALAVAAAVGEFVPYAGPIVAAAPAMLVALGTSPSTALIVALLYIGMQQLESYVIAPNVMKTQTDLHPALVILALAAGFSVGGLIGALAALPTFAALRVVVVAVAPYLRSRALSR